MASNSVSKGAVVVTGASTGIGAAVVVALHTAGFEPIPLVRRQEDVTRLEQLTGTTLFGLLADVRDQDALATAALRLTEHLGEGAALAGLVNNAGIAPPGPLMYQDFDTWQSVMDINCLGAVRSIKAFGKMLGIDELGVAKQPGRIVNVTSVAGQVGWPFLTAYSASKHAVEGMSDGLRRELMPYGVDVIVVGPGAVKTPIWGKAHGYNLDQYTGKPYAENLTKFVEAIERDGKSGLEPEKVADVIVTALSVENPKPRYAPVANPIMGWLLPRFLPRRWFDNIMAKMLEFDAK